MNRNLKKPSRNIYSNLQDLSFPAITICNLNKFRAPVLARYLPNVSKIIDMYRRKKIFHHRKTPDDWQSSDDIKRLFFEKIRSRSGIGDTSKIDSEEIGSVSSADILELLVLEESAKYPMENLKKAGHQFEKLVADCSWMGIACHSGYVGNG